MNTITKGAIGLQKVILRSIERGFIPSLPSIEGTRYDLIIDDNQNLSRVQIKYCGGKNKHGAYAIDLKKHTGGYNRKLYNYTSNEIDAVIVYLNELDKFLWVSPEDFNNKTTISFRVDEPKNGQKKDIKFVKDYLW